MYLEKIYLLKQYIFFSGKDNDQNASQYNDDLPQNLQFTYTREISRSILGQPQKSGGDNKIIPFWDKYTFDNYSLHLQFSKDSTIDLVTLISLKR